jgi:hypothetical protein
MGFLDGVLDMAMNSLDGNRNNNAEGKGGDYEENNPSGDGDNYNWFFKTSDDMDSDPPEIKIINGIGQEKNGFVNLIDNPDDVNLSNPILVEFNELMMSTSLRTYSVEILENLHEGINLYTLNANHFVDTVNSIGHWLYSDDFGTYPNYYTQLNIRHDTFSDDVFYRSRVGSAAKDLFQNCFMPIVGPNCPDPQNFNPDCCNGTPSATNTCN